MATEVIIRGTDEEIKLYGVLRSHYDRSENDLIIRRGDFDKKDELFRTFIDEDTWPYQAQVADPSTFTFIIEKTSRLIANKLRGRVTPRGNSDWLKAKVANELLDYQWDVANNGGSMLQKWALMDQNARKYGASFGICNWRYERIKGEKDAYCDNPEFTVLNNRDVLVNPDHPTIKEWFQYRTYVTIDELQNVNDVARAKPVYKNLDLLKLALKDKQEQQIKSDRRDVNWISRNKAIKGLTDTLGEDKYTSYIEIVNEYRPDRIITFAPKHGVVIRDIDNQLGEIPVVLLKYYAIDDDIYGLSEIEPIEKLQRGENALISQYLDTVNTDLYPPLLVRTTGVQLHTLEFGPNKKWLMTDPSTDVQRFQTSTAATGQFTATISFIISRMQNAVGETSEGVSNIDPTGGAKRTATEIRDSAVQRLSRDQFNQIFLSEALKRQMLLWLKLDAKLLDKNTLIRIVGKDSIAFFQKNMLVSPPTDPMTGQPQADPLTGQPAQASPYGPNAQGEIAPIYPVKQGGQEVPKFEMDSTGQGGNLIVEPKDLAGLFDYIPDVESMSIQQNEQVKQKMELINLITTNPLVLQLLQAEGIKPKVHDIIVEMLEDSGFKDAKRFFDNSINNAPQGQIGGLNGQGQAPQPQLPGAGIPQGGPSPLGNVSNQGLAGGIQTIPNGQAGPVVPGSVPGY